MQLQLNIIIMKFKTLSNISRIHWSFNRIVTQCGGPYNHLNYYQSGFYNNKICNYNLSEQLSLFGESQSYLSSSLSLRRPLQQLTLYINNI